MTKEAEILSNNYQIPVDFAQRLLNFTRNDLEQAIKILEACEKNVAIIKGKFLSSKKLFNGAFLFTYNFELRELNYFFIVVSNDASITRINIEQKWRDFYSDLFTFANSNSANMQVSNELERVLLSPDNIRYLLSFFVDVNNIDQVNLKRFLLSEIAKVLMDSAVAVKISIENTDIFSLQNFLKENPSGTKFDKRDKKDFYIIINLNVEPVLAPIGGVESGTLEFGDEILVKLKDEREIVQFLLGFINPDSFQGGAIYGSLFSKQLDPLTGNYLVRLEFGPGIFGSFLIGEKVRLQVRKKGSTIASSQSSTSTKPKNEKEVIVKPPEEKQNEVIQPLSEEREKEFFEKGPFQTFIAILLILIFVLIALLFLI